MIELILLGMLYDGFAGTTYDLKKAMERSTEFFHNSSLGSIQPALKKMEQAGYLTSKEQVENNRLKKYYKITDAGKAYFNQELRKDFGPDKLKCTQLVKIFFYDKLSLEEQLSSLDEYLNGLEETKQLLRYIEATGEERMAEFGVTYETYPAARFQMDTLTFGLDYYQFLTSWFESYREKLIARSQEVK